jgi:hypothetical protein
VSRFGDDLYASSLILSLPKYRFMGEDIMNAKKYVLVVIVLNTVLAAFAACFCHMPWQTQGEANDAMAIAMRGAEGKFGPTVEAVLSAGKIDGGAEILDLETGRALQLPPIDSFKSRGNAIMGWIRSKGLDISCNVWSGGATCVTYDMSVIAVEGTQWEKATEEELIRNPALSAVRHSPRRLLVLGHNRPDTYLFRTGEGTLGMLRIVGLSQDGRGVNILYKLVKPAKSSRLSLESMARF